MLGRKEFKFFQHIIDRMNIVMVDNFLITMAFLAKKQQMPMSIALMSTKDITVGIHLMHNSRFFQLHQIAVDRNSVHRLLSPHQSFDEIRLTQRNLGLHKRQQNTFA